MFYLNRTAYSGSKNKIIDEDDCTFKPSLCGRSLNIANTTRNTSKITTSEYIEQLLHSKEKNEK